MSKNVKTEAALTCPMCKAEQKVKMPADACQHFYKCINCGQALTSNESDCCVFCSYADTKCPREILNTSKTLTKINPREFSSFFECPKCKKRKGVYEDAEERVSKPTLCSKMRQRVQVNFQKEEKGSHYYNKMALL